MPPRSRARRNSFRLQAHARAAAVDLQRLPADPATGARSQPQEGVGDVLRRARAAGRRVILISIWRQPLEDAYLGRDQRVLKGAAATDDASAALKRTVAALRGAGAEVFVWEPLPHAQNSVPEATARSMVFGPHWPTATSLSSFRAEMAFFYAALDRAGVAKAARIDPTPTICPGGTCTFVRDGLPIYSDNNHPSHGSARLFAGIFASALP